MEVAQINKRGTWVMNFSKGSLLRFLDRVEVELTNARNKAEDAGLMDTEDYLDGVVGQLYHYRDQIKSGNDSVELRNSIRMTCKYASKVAQMV